MKEMTRCDGALSKKLHEHWYFKWPNQKKYYEPKEGISYAIVSGRQLINSCGNKQAILDWCAENKISVAHCMSCYTGKVHYFQYEFPDMNNKAHPKKMSI